MHAQGTRLSPDDVLILWDLLAGEVRARLQRRDLPRIETEPSPATAIITFRRWSEVSPELEHRDLLRSVAFSPDGTALAVTYQDYRLVLWDLEAREVMPSPFTLSWGAAFSPDGTLLVTGEAYGTLTFWNLETVEPLGDPIRAHAGGVWGLPLVPTGKRSSPARRTPASSSGG